MSVPECRTATAAPSRRRDVACNVSTGAPRPACG